MITILLFILILFLIFNRNREHFATTSPGTLIQLRAKGIQDQHLTGWPYIGRLSYASPFYQIPHWYFPRKYIQFY